MNEIVATAGNIAAYVAAHPVVVMAGVSAFCSWFVAMTPTPKDDATWSKIYKLVEVVGGTCLRAKEQ